ncbi:hypothetical protein ACFQFQ_27900 [Sulfitobacter porphyrae]|uniref:N-sulphoglucosamine sulphohydrolase C-terminal domain-containing protein n=1 Tax=Sulfitobacter porphyrae TaxID=1246864 RepID=A0ABW2BAI3_9RHOB
MLFDLQADPNELYDLGGRAEHAETIAEMYIKLNTWARRPSARTTLSSGTFINMRNAPRSLGVLIGIADARQAPAIPPRNTLAAKLPTKEGCSPASGKPSGTAVAVT